jgi:hypothetical protein
MLRSIEVLYTECIDGDNFDTCLVTHLEDLGLGLSNRNSGDCASASYPG